MEFYTYLIYDGVCFWSLYMATVIPQHIIYEVNISTT